MQQEDNSYSIKLELPRTVRPPRVDEIPSATSTIERLKKLNEALIVEGFKPLVDQSADTNYPYKFYTEINVDNSKLWSLISNLLNLFPKEIALIFAHAEAEPFYGKYMDKEQLWKELEDFKTELVEDSFLEWGLIFNDEDTLIEVFIKDSKYVQFWGSESKSFKKIMDNFSLQEIEGIEFIDEYPKVKISLNHLDSSMPYTSDVIDKLMESYMKNENLE